jgi:hypothetical protein
MRKMVCLASDQGTGCHETGSPANDSVAHVEVAPAQQGNTFQGRIELQVIVCEFGGNTQEVHVCFTEAEALRYISSYLDEEIETVEELRQWQHENADTDKEMVRWFVKTMNLRLVLPQE